MFKGHQFVKLLSDKWVLDLTEYQGYKVNTNSKGEVTSYTEAFEIRVEGSNIAFDKQTRVPLKVLKEAANQIIEYQAEIGEPIE
jgi:uncharacterized lipoprotein YajG